MGALSFPEACGKWADDVVWSWVNSQIARKVARANGRDEIRAMCSKVYILPDDPRRKRSVEDVLTETGHADLIERYREVWKGGGE
jgi:hypothetical protein